MSCCFLSTFWMFWIFSGTSYKCTWYNLEIFPKKSFQNPKSYLVRWRARTFLTTFHRGFFARNRTVFNFSLGEKCIKQEHNCFRDIQAFSGSNGQFWHFDWLSVRNFQHLDIDLAYICWFLLFFREPALFCGVSWLPISTHRRIQFSLIPTRTKIFLKMKWRFLLHFCNLIESTNLITLWLLHRSCYYTEIDYNCSITIRVTFNFAQNGIHWSSLGQKGQLHYLGTRRKSVFFWILLLHFSCNYMHSSLYMAFVF